MHMVVVLMVMGLGLGLGLADRVGAGAGKPGSCPKPPKIKKLTGWTSPVAKRLKEIPRLLWQEDGAVQHDAPGRASSSSKCSRAAVASRLTRSLPVIIGT